mmetsp:Transcript_24063/g.66853  ORF Transcript_24063/g.66853 Transcript_24063/m.66853 type:complete len:212 (+) Transcript_24063:568-1203(+)
MDGEIRLQCLLREVLHLAAADEVLPAGGDVRLAALGRCVGLHLPVGCHSLLPRPLPARVVLDGRGLVPCVEGLPPRVAVLVGLQLFRGELVAGKQLWHADLPAPAAVHQGLVALLYARLRKLDDSSIRERQQSSPSGVSHGCGAGVELVVVVVEVRPLSLRTEEPEDTHLGTDLQSEKHPDKVYPGQLADRRRRLPEEERREEVELRIGKA